MTVPRRARWISAGIMAVAIAVPLSACSSAGGSSGGVVTLTLLSHYDSAPMKPELQTFVNQWNKSHPQIQVKLQSVAFGDLQTTLNVRQAGGQGADILSSYALWGGQLQQNGVLATPPTAVTQDIKTNYSSAAVKAVTGPGGVPFGYPTEFNTYALFYNKKILQAAGFDQPPTTWAQLTEIANKTTKKDSSGNYKVEGLALTNDGDAPAAHPFLSLLNSTGGQFTDTSGASALDADALKTFTLESDLARTGATTMSIMPTKTFANGQVAMAIQAGWWIGTLKSQLGKDYQSTVGVAPVPGPAAGEHGSLAYAFFMGVNKHSKHAADAWKFLTWLNSAEQSDGVTRIGDWIAENGELPPRKADAAKLEAKLAAADPNLKPIYDAAAYAMAESNTPNATKAKNDLNNALQAMIVKHVSPQATYHSLISELNSGN